MIFRTCTMWLWSSSCGVAVAQRQNTQILGRCKCWKNTPSITHSLTTGWRSFVFLHPFSTNWLECDLGVLLMFAGIRIYFRIGIGFTAAVSGWFRWKLHKNWNFMKDPLYSARFEWKVIVSWQRCEMRVAKWAGAKQLTCISNPETTRKGQGDGWVRGIHILAIYLLFSIDLR